jgi:hypothetical protein
MSPVDQAAVDAARAALLDAIGDLTEAEAIHLLLGVLVPLLAGEPLDRRMPPLLRALPGGLATAGRGAR